MTIAIADNNWNSNNTVNNVDCTIGNPATSDVVWAAVLYPSTQTITSMGSDRGPPGR